MKGRQAFRGLILSRYNSGEADRVIKVLTRDQGLLVIRAKGVRKIASRRGSHVEPLTKIRGTAHVSSYGWYLTEVHGEEVYPELHRDMGALLHAQTLAYIYTLMFAEDDLQPEIYTTLERAWQVLPTLTSADRCILEVAIIVAMLKRAGHLPTLTECLACGSNDPGLRAFLTVEHGGWHCHMCQAQIQKTGRSFALNKTFFPLLDVLQHNPHTAFPTKVTAKQASELVAVFRHYIHALAGEKVSLSYGRR